MVEEIAMAALVRSHRLLLGHRHPQRRWYPNCWDLIGGHVELGETPQAAVRRECREEIAVEILEMSSVEVDIEDRNLRAHAFLVTRWTGSPTNAAPEEHDALRWFSSAQLAGLQLAHPSYASWLPRLMADRRAAIELTD